jgi:hypothetical protein
MIATCTLCGQILQAAEVLVRREDGAAADEQDLGSASAAYRGNARQTIKALQDGLSFQELALEVLKHMNQHHKQAPQVVALNQFFQLLGVTLASITAESNDSRYAVQRVVCLEGIQRNLLEFAQSISVPGGVPVVADSGGLGATG